MIAPLGFVDMKQVKRGDKSYVSGLMRVDSHPWPFQLGSSGWRCGHPGPTASVPPESSPDLLELDAIRCVNLAPQPVRRSAILPLLSEFLGPAWLRSYGEDADFCSLRAPEWHYYK